MMTDRIRTQTTCDLKRSDAVDVLLEMQIPLTHERVWDLVRDFPRFGCIDPMHRHIDVLGPELRPGVDLVIEHCILGVCFPRYGRLLTWQEGRGYAFSDLAAGRPDRYFPHAFFLEVESMIDPAWTRLALRVRGKWTETWIPAPLRRIWLLAITAVHAFLIRRFFQEVING